MASPGRCLPPLASRSWAFRPLHPTGESLADEPYFGPRAFCPRPVLMRRSPSPSPRLRPQATNDRLHLRRARAAGVRRHWQLAKWLSPSLTADDLAGWFIAAFDEGGRVPDCAVKRILWLIEVRAGFISRHNRLAHLRVNAAIWREVQRIKAAKAAKTLQKAAKTSPPFFPKPHV
jgi:hypothetical protein